MKFPCVCVQRAYTHIYSLSPVQSNNPYIAISNIRDRTFDREAWILQTATVVKACDETRILRKNDIAIRSCTTCTRNTDNNTGKTIESSDLSSLSKLDQLKTHRSNESTPEIIFFQASPSLPPSPPSFVRESIKIKLTVNRRSFDRSPRRVERKNCRKRNENINTHDPVTFLVSPFRGKMVSRTWIILIFRYSHRGGDVRHGHNFSFFYIYVHTYIYIRATITLDTAKRGTLSR